MNIESIPSDIHLGGEYKNHKVFKKINELIQFYDSLSFNVMSFCTSGTSAITNIDTYLFSSLKGTLESIHDILIKGRINDSYTLLRKYYDATIIDVYVILYLDDHINVDNLIVKEVDDWIKGNKNPNFLKSRVVFKYIKDSDKVSVINELLNIDKRYDSIRVRCNDQTHYNLYWNLLLNDNEVYIKNRIQYLNTFEEDLDSIFILHFAYLFYINDHYMCSSDYRDSLEMGYEPDEDSQYWVASFVQNIFNEIIKIKRPDIAAAIKAKTIMNLE